MFHTWNRGSLDIFIKVAQIGPKCVCSSQGCNLCVAPTTWTILVQARPPAQNSGDDLVNCLLITKSPTNSTSELSMRCSPHGDISGHNFFARNYYAVWKHPPTNKMGKYDTPWANISVSYGGLGSVYHELVNLSPTITSCARRAECDDLRSVLSSPLSGDTTLELSGDADCPILADNELEEFFVQGGTLTLTGPSTTKWVKVCE